MVHVQGANPNRAAVIGVAPMMLAMPGRGVDLDIRVSAPVAGGDLPVILLSHGYGSSRDGYAPLADAWAAAGFVVIQPTHLDSRRLKLAEDDPRRPLIWRQRVMDLKLCLDRLDWLVGAVPGLAGRADLTRVAVAGHSFGGQTAGFLLGARMIGADGEAGEDFSDDRIKAGVLLATAGRGGDDLSAFARAHTPYINSSFDSLRTPTLVVAGDADRSPLTVRGPDWFADPFHLSPGGRGLLTLFGGEHLLGGISGYGVAETTDENPDRVALVARMTTAFLRSELTPGDQSWQDACAALAAEAQPLGRIEVK
ncbi:alpha/beta hydrolase family protein [Pleomorphomonas sp. PLEO]|uniref:alpha/beta hydrolase family protein n=1 Tax=Pleomorphomonas sp. PLEO TaxID=3239306 RepID=UPI00351EC956